MKVVVKMQHVQWAGLVLWHLTQDFSADSPGTNFMECFFLDFTVSVGWKFRRIYFLPSQVDLEEFPLLLHCLLRFPSKV